jgi:hypothetical protein
MRRLFSTSLLIISVILCYAQEEDTIKIKPAMYIVTEGGVYHASYRDAGVSPLIYSGSMPVIALGFKATHPDYIFTTHAGFHTGKYSKTTDGSKYITQAYELNLRSDYFRRTSAGNENLFFFMGAGLSYDLSVRDSPHYRNSRLVMNNIIGLSIHTRLQHNFTFPSVEKKNQKGLRPERHYSIAANLHVPFASVMQHPGYSYVSHSTVNGSGEFDLYKWNVLVFSGLALRLELLKYLENGNALGLSYNFLVFSSKNYLNNYYQSAGQSLMFSLLYRLK